MNSCSSYVTGYSEESDNYTHFTYYSEFGRSWSGAGPTEACVLLLIFVASVGANTMVIYRGIKSRLFRSTANYFILNLALADLTFSLTIPFVAVIRITETWVFRDVICRLIVCLQVVCGGVVIWSLVAVSINRYHCIVARPLHRPPPARRIGLLLAAVWVSPSAICVPFALHFRVVDVDCDGAPVSVCTLIFPTSGGVRISVVLFTLLMIYVAIVPAVLLIYFYCRMFAKLSEIRRPAFRRLAPSRSSTAPILSQRPDLSRSMPTVTLLDDAAWYADLRATKSMTVLPSCPPLPSSITTDLPTPFTRRFRDTLTVSWAATVRNRRNYRAIQILLANVIVVFVMWTPMWAMLVALFVDSSETGAHRITSHGFLYCLMVAFASSFVNAVLYGMLNGNFRQYFRLPRWCFCRALRRSMANPVPVPSLEAHVICQ